MLRLISICALSIICSISLLAQNQAKVFAPAERETGNQFSRPQQGLDLYPFFGVVDRILALHDVQAKALGAAQLADILWKYDDARARQVFERTLRLTDTKPEPEKRNALVRLRQNVLVLIAKHDAAWAKRLIDAKPAADQEDSPSDRGETNLTIASSLLTDEPDIAAEFATRSLQEGVNPALIWFLRDLRVNHEREADQLFLQALTRFVQQPALDLNDFALLGTYIFTSPKMMNADPGGVIITRVGNIGIVDITADRADASPLLVRAFLSAGVAVLSRPMPDAYQRQTAYALGYILSQKVRRFAPDLLGPLSSAMSSLAPNVPPAATQDSAFTNLNKVRPDTSEVMSNAEKTAESQGRDIAYLDVAFHAWLKKDFQTGRIAAGKIAAQEVAGSLAVLMNFGEGSSLLKQPSKLVEAEAFATRLPLGVERAVLFLGIGRSAEKAGDQTKALEAISIALQASRSVDDARRPFLLLIAAGQLADLDAVAAHSALTEATKEFNQQEDAMLRNVSWERRVEIGALVEKFPLNVEGLEFRFGPAFRDATSANVDYAILTAYALKSETLRSRAFVEIGKAILNSLAAAEQNKGIVVRVGEDGMRKSAAKAVMPPYPDEAKKSGQQGLAVTEVEYNGKGNVTEAVILESPAPSIGEAVLSAVRQWKFKPSTLKGEPISVRGKLTFYFVIDKDGNARVENPKQFQ